MHYIRWSGRDNVIRGRSGDYYMVGINAKLWLIVCVTVASRAEWHVKKHRLWLKLDAAASWPIKHIPNTLQKYNASLLSVIIMMFINTDFHIFCLLLLVVFEFCFQLYGKCNPLSLNCLLYNIRKVYFNCKVPDKLSTSAQNVVFLNVKKRKYLQEVLWEREF